MNYRTPNCVSAGLPARSLRGRLSFRVIPGYPVLRVVRGFLVCRKGRLSTLNSQGLPRRSASADLCTASRFLRHWCRSRRSPEVVDSHQLAQTRSFRSFLLTWVRLARKSRGALHGFRPSSLRGTQSQISNLKSLPLSLLASGQTTSSLNSHPMPHASRRTDTCRARCPPIYYMRRATRKFP